MLSEIRHVIAKELSATESRMWARLKPLFEEKGENEFGGTFEDTANLFIPDLGQCIMLYTHNSDRKNGQS